MYRARHGSLSRRQVQKCGSPFPSGRFCWRRGLLQLRRPEAVDTTGEPADSVAPTAHTGSRPSYGLARACLASSSDAGPTPPSSCLCVSRSSSHPRSNTLSRRAIWDGLDVLVALGVVAALQLPPQAASPRESGQARLRPHLPRALGLARENGSTLPSWVHRQSDATALATFAFLHRASTPAARLRSTDIGAWRAHDESVGQIAASAHPDIEWELASDTSVVSRVNILLFDTTWCSFPLLPFPKVQT